MASVGILSDPVAFRFLNVLILLLISVFDGVSVLAGCMCRNVSDVSLFNSSTKRSTHLFNCFFDVVRGFPL